jgi:hypothetical protein
MPSEIRLIIFTNEEIVSSIVSLQKKRGQRLPGGTINNILIDEKPNSTETPDVTLSIEILAAEGTVNKSFRNEEIAAALINYCLTNRTPLPRLAEKTVRIIDGKVTLLLNLRMKQTETVMDAATNFYDASQRPSDAA